MPSAQITALRKAAAMETAADVVLEHGRGDSEHVQLIREHKEAGVLTGRFTADESLVAVVAGLAEIVGERVPAKAAKKSGNKAKKS
jgi:hypothetical protein